MDIATLRVNKATSTEASKVFYEMNTISLNLTEMTSLCKAICWNVPINFYLVEHLELRDFCGTGYFEDPRESSIFTRKDVLEWLATLPRIKSVVINCQELFDSDVAVTEQLRSVRGTSCLGVGRWRLHGFNEKIEMRHVVFIRFYEAATDFLSSTTLQTARQKVSQCASMYNCGSGTKGSYRYELLCLWQLVYDLKLADVKVARLNRLRSTITTDEAKELEAFSEEIIRGSRKIQQVRESYGALNEL